MPNPNEEHVEPAPEMLGEVSNAGALAAIDAALSGQPAPTPPVETPKADPQPGDALPPPDSAPQAPEGDGATDPNDNAPASEPPKPDDKKTEVPTDPKADEPAVDPKPDGGMQKKPSDEFGELDKDVPPKTRERFETMKGRYDAVVGERDAFKQQASEWVETVKSTGATPEQFGMSLNYLKLVNDGTPESLQKAYDIMAGEMAVLAEALGREVPGVHDPLAKHPDLAKRVEEDTLDRADALEIAAGRQRTKLAEASATAATAGGEQQAAVDAGLRAVAAYGDVKRTTDPHYAAKTAAIKPLVERVVANLPPDQWAQSIKELYEAQPDPVVAAAPPPVVPQTPIRPTSTPGVGGGLDKKPGNALEAVNAALSQL
jgi:hypothetical protein